jgi:hypothetical protein
MWSGSPLDPDNTADIASAKAAVLGGEDGRE